MRERIQADMNRRGDQFIVAGLASLVEDSGFTPHEAFDILESIKANTWHALADIHSEVKRSE